MSIAFVKETNSVTTGTGTTATVAPTATPGNLLVLMLVWAVNLSGSSISLTSGTTWTNLSTAENANANLVYWAGYMENCPAAPSTVFTVNAHNLEVLWIVREYSGVLTSGSLGFTTSKDPGKTTTLDTGAISGTTGANDLLVGLFSSVNSANMTGLAISGSSVPSTGWNLNTVLNGTSGNSPHAHTFTTDQILTAPAVNPDSLVTFSTPTAGESNYNVIATFKAAAPRIPSLVLPQSVNRASVF